MAVGIHVVYVAFVAVDSSGNYINKNDASTTISQVMSSSHDHRVIPDSAIATSANWPTIKAYLEAEAANNYIVKHMTQTMIVTYNKTDIYG